LVSRCEVWGSTALDGSARLVFEVVYALADLHPPPLTPQIYRRDALDFSASMPQHDLVIASDPLYADDITAAFHVALCSATDPRWGLACAPVLLLYKKRCVPAPGMVRRTGY
jgi:hypothetical protein